MVNNVEGFIKRRNELKSILPKVRVTYVMTENNKKNSDKFIKMWRDKADIIGIQSLITYGNIEKDKCTEIEKDISDYSCYMPKVRLSVRSDGTVHPCCTVPGMSMKIGDINRQTLDSIWNGPAMKKIRESHLDGTWHKNKICEECVKNTN